MKLFTIFLITVLLLQAFAEASPFSDAANSTTNTEEGNYAVVALSKKAHHLPKINCDYACSRRCRKASRKKICKRACKSCCERCHCVPPGTYGNKKACPCYAKLKTHGNKPKCP
ncbi:unnamed protein product [Prunus brigantina]